MDDNDGGHNMFITAMIEGSGWLFFLSIVLSTCCSRVASMFGYLRDYICFKATILRVLPSFLLHIGLLCAYFLYCIALHSSSECPFI